MAMCRACLTTKKDLVPMDETFVNNYNILTSLNITLTHEMPLYSCNTCFDAIKFCMEFREKCISSDITLKELILPNDKSNNSEDTKFEMKQEIKEEYDTASIIFEDYYEELSNDYVNRSSSETGNDDDYIPNSNIKPLKKAVKRKGIASSNVKDEKHKTDFDDTLEHCDYVPNSNIKPLKKAVKRKRIASSNVIDEKHKADFDDTLEHDYVPNNNIKPLKKAVKRKRIASSKVKDEKHKTDFGDTLEHCGLCSKKFTNREDLVKHFEHHKLDKNCGQCPERLIDFTHLLAHRFMHVPDNEKRCHICSQRFTSADRLEYHYLKKHNLRGKDGKLLCKICLSSYLTPSKLSKHVNAVHSDIKYMCNECGKGFRVKQSLKSHLKSHNEERPYKCDKCDYTCRFLSGIREHKVRKHTKGRVYCRTCGRAFATPEILDKHVCKHIKGVVCPICGINVCKSSHLPRHIDSHTNAYRYRCDRCPAQFKSITSYKSHKNKHDGNKTFHCEHCPMKFYSHPVLIKHRRTHTGEKPYVCTICSKGFTANHNLKVHMRVHGQDLIVKRTTKPPVHIFDKL